MTSEPGAPQAESLALPGALMRAVNLHRSGRFRRARDLYSKLLEAHPGNADVIHMRGMLELERGGPELAVPWLERAASIAPSDARIQINLGLAYELCARLDDARYAFERAAQFAPNLARPKISLAGVWTHLKRDDEAERILREVFARHPAEPQACVLSSEIFARRGEYDQAERALLVALSRTDLDGRQRGAVLMSKGKLLDKVERYDEAFEAFAEGNRLRSVAYDPTTYERAVERYISVWTSDLIERLAPLGSESTQPVFIIGMPRSGTSLTEQIIAMHEGVFAGGERLHMYELQMELASIVSAETNYPECLNEPACIANWNRVVSVAESAYREMAPDASRITDKLPSNSFRVGLLASVFPKASLVHCMRDPRDAALSCFMQDFFAQSVRFSNDLEHIGRYYRSYKRVMEHWYKVLPGQILESPYENLVTDSESATKRLMKHIGVPWDERCLQFHRSERFVPTASAQQVRQPMYTSAVARWKRYEKHLAPLLKYIDD